MNVRAFCCRVNTPRKQGGLGSMNIPLVSDPKRTIAQDYGVLKADEGISFRYLPAGMGADIHQERYGWLRAFCLEKEP